MRFFPVSNFHKIDWLIKLLISVIHGNYSNQPENWSTCLKQEANFISATTITIYVLIIQSPRDFKCSFLQNSLKCLEALLIQLS